MGKPSNQVKVDLVYACRTHTRNLCFALLPRVQTSDRRTLAIDKRLNTEADAIHLLPKKFVQRLASKLTRSALERDLRSLGNVELAVQMLEDPPELLRGE